MWRRVKVTVPGIGAIEGRGRQAESLDFASVSLAWTQKLADALVRGAKIESGGETYYVHGAHDPGERHEVLEVLIGQEPALPLFAEDLAPAVSLGTLLARPHVRSDK